MSDDGIKKDKNDIRNRVDKSYDRQRLIDACNAIISLIEDDGDIEEVGGEPIVEAKNELKKALEDFQFGGRT